MDEPASLNQPSMGPVSEQRIGGYRVVHPLGAGGMSSVFLAVHVETGNEVALKVLTRTLARNSTLLQRFLREARSAETLQHPNIVTIYDRGIDRGRHYLVLEYVAGGDFHEYIRDHGPLPAAEAISVVKSVAAGLNYAATRGLIHRDIKPSNILRTPAGQIKIIDLGLALQNEFEDERVTREGTTVGTVDYMAPEQARDSRATSIQSDIYSLGCTLYYFLSGVPPFPGGDITDKLTRHAKSPVPNVCDLRQDVPASIATLIEKMMAKRPEDRFRSYDDLIAALANVASGGLEDSPDIALVPLETEKGDEPSAAAAADPWPSVASGEYATSGSGPGDDLEFTLAELAGEFEVEPGKRSIARSPMVEPPRPIPRQGLDGDEETIADDTEFHEIPSLAPSQPASSVGVWIISGAFIGIAFILLAIGMFQLMDSSPVASENPAIGSDAEVVSDRPIAAASRANLAAITKKGGPAIGDRARSPVEKGSVAGVAEPAWLEPIDVEAADIDAGKNSAHAEAEARFLPDWSRSPVPDRIDGPFVVVRRTFTSGDPFKLPALDRALDRHRGGTIELADEGPLYVDDFRVGGDNRLIRARPGYRPIVRVEGSSVEAIRTQRAVIVLDGKNLTLDGIDLVVDVKDLSSEQTALFSCSSASLTLRNCSITILNNGRVASFAVVRTEPGQSRSTRIRFESTLVRGLFSSAFELAGGTELALKRSVVLGGPGPLVRVTDGGSTQEQRLFLFDSILAGPGPIIQRGSKDPGPEPRPLMIRAFGTVFGRFHGKGVASVISSASAIPRAVKQIDWAGDNNLFAGWKGFFASGNDPMVMITELAEVRSTWNGADQNSHEIFASWQPPSNLAATTPAELRFFVPGRESILLQVAQPRSGLFQKAVGDYPTPTIPQPIGWTSAGLGASGKPSAGQVMRTPLASGGNEPGRATARSVSTFAVTPSSAVAELTFNTESLPWAGDLGAFLHDRLTPGMRNVRITVLGSGPHRFTPVRLHQGLWLEIRVEPLAAAEPPSWSPQPNATGPALIELKEGALILSNLVLRHEETSRLEHLIRVEDGHLLLSRCQFISQQPTADFPGDLIAFTAVSTRPYPKEPNRLLFSPAADRPVCRMDETVLITGGTALRVELGRGLVALTQCAIAAGTNAIELLPSRVSRQRFEADLVMDRCTMTSERSVIRLGPWPGLPPGADRPWLITSQNCAFPAVYDRKSRETVLLRADADALARGTVSWQARDDAVDVDSFIAVADSPLPSNRSRDLQLQWIHFWGRAHMNGRMTGTRGAGAGSVPSVQLWEKLRPGRIEPVDLILNPDHHLDRDVLNVGADLGWLGSKPRTARSVRVRG